MLSELTVEHTKPKYPAENLGVVCFISSFQFSLIITKCHLIFFILFHVSKICTTNTENRKMLSSTFSVQIFENMDQNENSVIFFANRPLIITKILRGEITLLQ